MSSAPPSFPEVELKSALSEQSFGIKGFKIVDSSDYEASAQTHLLEGYWIRLTLTTRGYQLHDVQGPSGEVYESVEGALEVVSPLYTQAKHKALEDKLAALTQAQAE